VTETPRALVRFSGLILAGGVGRRWGGPKAFARLPDDRTFLEGCRDVLAGAGARPVAATVPPGVVGDEVAGVRLLPLPSAGLDMLDSLGWGLRHLLAEPGWQTVVVLPVDHPLVSSSTVLAVATATAPVVVPVCSGKHGHPLSLDRRTAVRIARGEVPGATVRDVVGAVGIVDVEVDDPAIHYNCNDPSALERYLGIDSGR
jgi:CTP:molybdopterin cytidylyltransferase MocA